MSDRLLLTEDENFSFVMSRSRELATQFNETIDIKRTNIGWAIFVSIHVYEFINSSKYDESDDGTYYEDPYSYEDPHEDERRLLTEELTEDQESWARSEEDGWYYED